MRTKLLLLALAIVLAGCGSKSSAPAPTAVSLSTYRDRSFGFSFKYPSSWSIPKQGGHVENDNGVKTYVLSISVPGNDVQASVTVDADVVPLPSFQNAEVRPDPNGSAHTFQYFHATLSGWPAMKVKRFTGKQVTEQDTIANTHSRSYDVRILTVSPPLPSDILRGYTTIVKTMKVPFS